MIYDIFFSISQTPVDGYTPDEAEMFENFFRQVEVADQMGFSTAWIAEAHFSSQVQKEHRKPVIPHWLYRLSGWWRWIQQAKANGAKKLLGRQPYLVNVK